MGVGRIDGAPRKVDVTVVWAHQPDQPVTRSYWLPRYARVADTLDGWAPRSGLLPERADALIEVRCDGPCWAQTAIYYAPLTRGVSPALAALDMHCETRGDGTR